MSTRNRTEKDNSTFPRQSETIPNEFANDDTRQDEFSEINPTETRDFTPARNVALWLILALSAAYGIFALGVWSIQNSSQPPLIGPISPRAATSSAKTVIHVVGAVRRPGVYVLPENARVFQALEKAGGTLKNGDTNALNLADWAQDGTRIEVPFKAKTVRRDVSTETPKVAPQTVSDAPISPENLAPIPAPTPEISASANSFATDSSPSNSSLATPASAISSTRNAKNSAMKPAKPAKKRAKVISKTIAGLPRALTPKGKLSDKASPEFLRQHPLDLNKITREQLETLPGVGPSLAQKILDFRAQNGGFKNIDELDDVSGIGEKKLENLRPLLYVLPNSQPKIAPKIENSAPDNLTDSVQANENSPR